VGANRKGNRTAKRSNGMALAQTFPDEMRARFAPMLDSYITEFEYDLTTRTLTVGDEDMPNPAHRTAMDLYPRIMRVIGASDELIGALLLRLGMPDEPALTAASELYRAVQGQDVLSIYRECKRMTDWCESADGPLPELRLTNGHGGKR
jgi:hypothetical protein